MFKITPLKDSFAPKSGTVNFIIKLFFFAKPTPVPINISIRRLMIKYNKKKKKKRNLYFHGFYS